ncbi:MAG: hypothetical protein ACRDHZ_14530 [Ktedonobacteraceae bacterium]
MIAYPTPHLEKLEATLTNEKLPQRDKPQVEQATQHYHQWIQDMNSIMISIEPAYVLLTKTEVLDEKTVLERGYF